MLSVRPLTATFAARIENIDLRTDLNEESVHDLQKAFSEHKVLFFEGQDLTIEQFEVVAAVFGEPQSVQGAVLYKDITRPTPALVVEMVHDSASPGAPDNCFHNDSTHLEEPELGGILMAAELPPLGGDTIWADMHAAFNNLDENIQNRILGMRAVHDVIMNARYATPSPTPERIVELHTAHPPVTHPVVRTHPVTGEKAIWVNPVWTSHIVGLSRSESDELLGFLFRQATKPEFQYRFTWRPGSIVVWDNRILQHYAVADYGPHRRVMERISLKGDRPF
jgi:taurine dioxygenase